MEFLTFKSFISIDVLILFYNIGAIVMPIAVWSISSFVFQKFHIINSSKKIVWNSLSKKQRFYIVLIFVGMFIFMEIFWRMIFEFLIAYMQIRDALVG
jgi:hypothetical protein